MKKSDVLRRRTRKMIAKNLIVLVTLAVVAVVGASSWFAHITTVTATGFHAATEVSDKLEFFILDPSHSEGKTVQEGYSIVNSFIATLNNNHDEDTGWHTGSVEFDFSDDEEDFLPEFKFMKNLLLQEVTSNGQSFYQPSITQSGDHAVVDESPSASFLEAKANEDYLSFDIYFRSLKRYKIALTYESKIEPNNKLCLSGQNTYPSSNSEYADEIKAGAIGAVRMSVVEGNTTQLLWVPAPNVWYNGMTKTLYTGLTSTGSGNFNFGDDKGSVYLNNNQYAVRPNVKTTDHTYYTKSGNTAATFNKMTEGTGQNDTSYLYASKDPNCQYQIGANSTANITVGTMDSTPVTDNGETYYVGRIRVNLWIEGEDAEARLDLVGGQFDMNLKFDVKLITQ